MSEAVRYRFGRVGISRQIPDNRCNSKPEDQTRPLFHKKNSWTNLATKARRLSSRRRTSSNLSSTKASKESTNNVQRTSPSYEKGLEDYTAWCNHYLIRGLHREVTPDLRTAVGDGLTLVNLVECLSRKTIHNVSRQPATWSQKLDNIHACFQFLNSLGLRTNGISPEEIIEGRLKSILKLLQCLETHFENVRYPAERKMDESQSRSPVNGRISSGYHSEDDAYLNGRTTPTIEALPGLLDGSDTDNDNDSFDSSILRLHHDGKTSSPLSQTKPHSNRGQSLRAERSLDNIGYMPSHPSRKKRASSKSKYDGQTSPEDRNMRHYGIASTSNVKLETAETGVFLTPEDESFHAKDNYGLEFDFDLDDSISLDRASLSSTGTPVLPDLSSESSFEDLPLDFSSDAASGLQTRDSFTTSSKLSQDSFRHGKYITEDVQKQISALHSMYEKLLALVDKDVSDSRRKSKLNLPRVAMLQAKGKNSNKRQRSKDMKSVSRRFNRIESNVVTLARNIDHLRSEIRSHAETSQQLDELRIDVHDFKDSIYSGNYSHKKLPQRSRDYDQQVRRLQKLKSFFGEEPPMVAILLQKMGYERFIPHFKAEEVGILELPYMTEQRLQNLGIPLGPRLRILEEIQNLR
ncbi:uncharacterized protein LOC114532308 [Dendronephthya gigantea]|uniref:uncharacterized protein LOC114532308 n=1 Tax=Dendronephthya gigantea TaxID=151771 RepID=UPI00106934C0|nr:uncharacterized protein LOC114532308 [Dendronephthya gigantea]